MHPALGFLIGVSIKTATGLHEVGGQEDEQHRAHAIEGKPLRRLVADDVRDALGHFRTLHR